ncbi:MAG TPA: hypothetical protein VEL79_07215, partial [Vicinamibacterales bacterium]|nr:hypothetical protein [Vicinamibacterales bacterium]
LRAPVRYIVLVQFALGILAALAFDDLVAPRSPVRRLVRTETAALCSVAVASVLTTALANTHAVGLPAALPLNSAAQAAVGTAFVIAATIAVLLAARHVAWAPAALILITAADLGFWGLRYVYQQPPEPMASLTRDIPRAPKATPIRVSVPERWADRPGLKDYQIVPGYVGLYPATQHPAAGAEFQRLAGVRWKMALDGTMTAFDGLPRARLIASADAPRIVDSAAAARVVLDEPGHIVVEASASSARILALTERFDVGWQVSSDGAPAQALRVAEDFLGSPVDGGTHRMEFRFRPRSFVFGAGLSVFGAVLLIAGIATVTSQTRRLSKP